MKNRTFAFVKKLLFSVLFGSAILFLFSSCDSGFKDSLKEDFTSLYVYFAYSPDEEVDGGNVEISYPIGEVLSQSDLPTVSDERFASLKVGYNIDGWKYFKNPLNNTTDTPETISLTSDGLISSVIVTSYPAWLYASSWSAVNYTVLLDSNGGSYSYTDSSGNQATQTQIEQAFVYDTAQNLEANVFSRNGYSFNGWNIASNRNSTVSDYADEESVTNLATKEGTVVTLYACWIKDNIIISFNANGGSGTMSNTVLQVDDELPANQFTRTGYSFVGWNTESDGSGSFFSDKQVLSEAIYPNQDTTFYAQWQKNTYYVEYYANEGSETSMTAGYEYDSTVTVEDGNSYFFRYGYDFASWNTSADGSGTTYAPGDTFTIDENGKTLYAQWTVQTCTITFEANGGSGTMASQTMTFEDLPQKLTANSFTKTGYNFIEWISQYGNSYEDEGEISESNWISGEVTFYAQWSPVPFTVTYDSNDSNSSQATQTVYYGISDSILGEIFTRTGYDFVHWNTAADGSGTSYSPNDTITLTDGDITLYAIWSVQCLTVIFDANGGSGSMESQTMTFEDLPQKLTENAFSLGGYYFSYWATYSSGDGTHYVDAATIKDSNWVSGTLVLYAIWTRRASIVGTMTSGLSVEYGETSFTFSVSGGYTSYKWLVDGDEVSDATTSSVTLNYDDFNGNSTKTHSLILIAYEYDEDLGADVPKVFSASFRVHDE